MPTKYLQATLCNSQSNNQTPRHTQTTRAHIAKHPHPPGQGQRMRPGGPAQLERLHARQRASSGAQAPPLRGPRSRHSSRRAPRSRPGQRGREAPTRARRAYRDRASLRPPAAPSPARALCRAPRPARGCLHWRWFSRHACLSTALSDMVNASSSGSTSASRSCRTSRWLGCTCAPAQHGSWCTNLEPYLSLSVCNCARGEHGWLRRQRQGCGIRISARGGARTAYCSACDTACRLPSMAARAAPS